MSSQFRRFHELKEQIHTLVKNRRDTCQEKKPKRVPTVLSQQEAQKLFEKLHGDPLFVANLIHGSGLRIGEVIAIRLKDCCKNLRN